MSQSHIKGPFPLFCQHAHITPPHHTTTSHTHTPTYQCFPCMWFTLAAHRESQRSFSLSLCRCHRCSTIKALCYRADMHSHSYTLSGTMRKMLWLVGEHCLLTYRAMRVAGSDGQIQEVRLGNKETASAFFHFFLSGIQLFTVLEIVLVVYITIPWYRSVVARYGYCRIDWKTLRFYTIRALQR